MTPISRKNKKGEPCNPTVRITDNEYRGRYHADAGGRKLVVSLLPGDMLCLRPHGTRRAEYMRLSDVYDILLWSRVRSERMQKINHKKRSRK